MNAIYLASDFVGRVRERAAALARTGARDEGYEVPYTTLHVGVIGGGTALNIVPDRCEIELEIRNLAADDPRLLVAGLKDDAALVSAPERASHPHCGVEVVVTNSYPGLDTPADADVVELVAGLIGHRECIKVGFGSEGGLYSGELGIPSVVCGPGSIEQAHKADEYVALEQLAACDRFIEGLVGRLSA